MSNCRFEANASSYDLPDYQLFTNMQCLLKGKALQWYWVYKESNRLRSLLEFRNVIIIQFQDDRNNFDIRHFNLNRKFKKTYCYELYVIRASITSLMQMLKSLESYFEIYSTAELASRSLARGQKC